MHPPYSLLRLYKVHVKDLLERFKENDQTRFLRFLTSICYQRSYDGAHHKLVIRRNQSLVSETLLNHFMQIIMPVRLMPKRSMPRGDQLPDCYIVWPDTFAREASCCHANYRNCALSNCTHTYTLTAQTHTQTYIQINITCTSISDSRSCVYV